MTTPQQEILEYLHQKLSNSQVTYIQKTHGLINDLLVIMTKESQLKEERFKLMNPEILEPENGTGHMG
jgi:hypothetical protein